MKQIAQQTFNTTLLIKKIIYNKIIVRKMQAHCQMLKRFTVSSITHGKLSIQNRTYASAHAGRLKLPKKTPLKNDIETNSIEKITASCDNTVAIKSDFEGHFIGVLAVCKNTKCKDTNCAEGIQETNPCKISGEEHQEPLFVNNTLINAGVVVEINGALTHKIPEGCEGTFLKNVDINGNNKNQYIMRETGVIPLKKEHFHENTEKTVYVQQNEVTGHMVQNASPNSVMNLSNKKPSTLLAKIDTPLDETL